jgi:hypothetical protein
MKKPLIKWLKKEWGLGDVFGPVQDWLDTTTDPARNTSPEDILLAAPPIVLCGVFRQTTSRIRYEWILETLTYSPDMRIRGVVAEFLSPTSGSFDVLLEDPEELVRIVAVGTLPPGDPRQELFIEDTPSVKKVLVRRLPIMSSTLSTLAADKDEEVREKVAEKVLSALWEGSKGLPENKEAAEKILLQMAVEDTVHIKHCILNGLPTHRSFAKIYTILANDQDSNVRGKALYYLEKPSQDGETSE